MIEQLHEIVKQSVSGGFMKFCGYFIMASVIIGLPLATIISILNLLINRPLRHANIRKHGYPPTHCDADGDFKDKTND